LCLETAIPDPWPYRGTDCRDQGAVFTDRDCEGPFPKSGGELDSTLAYNADARHETLRNTQSGTSGVIHTQVFRHGTLFGDS